MTIVTKNYLVTRDVDYLREQYSQLFHVACRKAGLRDDGPELSTAAFHRPALNQMELEF